MALISVGQFLWKVPLVAVGKQRLQGCLQLIRETDAKQLNENSFDEQTRSESVLITWKLFRKWLTFGC